MTRLVMRAWVPLVMVIVVAVAAFTVSRLHGIFGSNMYRPDAGNADAIVQFNPKHVLYEIYAPQARWPTSTIWMRMPNRSGSTAPLYRGHSSSSQR